MLYAEITVMPAQPNPLFTTEELRHCSHILDFWHKVEFFLPFDLQRITDVRSELEWSVRQLDEDALRTIGTRLWEVPGLPSDKRLIGFDLFLGVFDKSDLSAASQRAARAEPTERAEPSEVERQDEEERSDSKGLTCCAKVRVDAEGRSQFDEVSVSTAPWALGRIQECGLRGLEWRAFQDGLEVLKERLGNFRAERVPAALDGKADPNSAGGAFSGALTGQDLLDLLDVFYDWAGFRLKLQGRCVIVIRAIAGRKKTPAQRTASERDVPVQPEAPLETEEEGDEEPPSEVEIDILNSFFARDIERALEALGRDQVNPCLRAYLAARPHGERVDLYTSAGRERILKDLHPRRMTSGRWFSDPQHYMSLMQQFAINDAFHGLHDEGLFSINGPPGTGKTTLLRDIIAENVVRRARVLAGLARARDAFAATSIAVGFNDGKEPHSVALLRPELTGFEMIVASSNNRAVENVSADLPKMKSLGAAHAGHPWRPSALQAGQTYLKAIAHKIAAQNENGEYRTLEPDDIPWGLISCALGKRENRGRFARRFSAPAMKEGDPHPNGYDKELHQSVWEWRDEHPRSNFAKARMRFRNADEQVERQRSELARLADLDGELSGHTLDSFVEAQAQAAERAEKRHVEERSDSADLEKSLDFHRTQLGDLQRAEELLRDRRPPWWARALRRPAYLRYLQELDANLSAQAFHLKGKLEFQSWLYEAGARLEKAREQVARTREELAARRRIWDEKQAELQALRERFPLARRPEQASELDEQSWQIQGVWRDEELDRLRSELFAAALALHETWLAEVLQKGGGFGGNVVALCKMLSGVPLSTPAEHALPLWRSLFMIVPVISSTFASIASQFHAVGMGAFGWLFIDEAGQAPPQAAVGALWRSKRAVVIGDPLQIEPIFTVPIKLIEALGHSSPSPVGAAVEPHRSSVQKLADLANELGTWIADDGAERRQWIGSPLRVHRRCQEPMFGIANSIAYDGKMVYGLRSRAPSGDVLGLGGSAWVNLGGDTNHKQVVPAQIDLVVHAVVAQYEANGTLPPLYIISPFRRIKEELNRRLSASGLWRSHAGGSRTKPERLREWCDERIGTVHTFQGKEESEVWMVLGCDTSTAGAVEWASSKPNLLNVAMTRAQHRVFVIGDVDLWGDQRFFKEAIEPGRLPIISGEEFLCRLALTSVEQDADGFQKPLLRKHPQRGPVL